MHPPLHLLVARKLVKKDGSHMKMIATGFQVKPRLVFFIPFVSMVTFALALEKCVESFTEAIMFSPI